MDEEWVLIAVYVPPGHTDAVCQAMFEAGAGTVDDGRYERVAFVSTARMRVRELSTATAHVSDEERVEMICHRERVRAVIDAILAVHPYEVPAISVIPMLNAAYGYWSD